MLARGPRFARGVAVFRVKICGVTTPADAKLAADAGADAIGINFYAKSKRCVSSDDALAIVDAAAGRLACVGVFVNEPATRVVAVATRLGLAAIQLHGDEPPESLAEYGSRPLIRARRVGAGGLDELAADLAACQAAGANVAAVLADAPSPGGYGGTGHVFDWRSVAGHHAVLGCPLLLAGGLAPGNVADAIRSVGPQGVDVASGVESSPGVKDPQKTAAFVRNALAALADGA